MADKIQSAYKASRKKGWFTPPFQTEDELRRRLTQLYGRVEPDTDGSIVCFNCVK